jgi:3-oxoacyl-[acyl-carrier protein] reductase
MSTPASKTVIVTGAARGIGLTTAQGFVRLGHRVLLCDINADELVNATRELPAEQVAACAVDLGAEGASAEIDTQVQRRWGPANILVNNAGIAPKYNGVALNILDMTSPEWERILHINLTSVMRLCQQILPSMKDAGWGRVVNVSSSGGRTRSLGPVGPAYMASKYALLGLTRHIATELGPFGITANVVAPGRIATALGATTGAAVAADYAKRVPVGRIGNPDEVAAAIEFLASERASFINGAVIDVNGGMFML